MNDTQRDTSGAVEPILGHNPLLEALGRQIPYEEISREIAANPLPNYAIGSITQSQREDLLALRFQHFAPTTPAISIAAALQVQLREHYISQNPLNAALRRKLYKLASYKGKKIEDVPWSTDFASGIVIKGITGTGKSTVWKRFVSLYPQSVEHGSGVIPGFDVVTQIVWLHVDMSADGSRAGFLLSILGSVDNLIHTNYFEQYSKSAWTVEKLMVVVGIVLSTHFCGMLIIEEIQAKNFSDSQWGSELATFFLRLLNFGIPVVLVGNPLGFDKLPKHSQIWRRLTMGGCFQLDPAETLEDFDWKESLVPGIWDFDVMPVKTPLTPELAEALYKYSGGINDFLMRLKVEAQRIAIRRGKSAVELMHFEEAYHGPTFIENHALIRGFADKDIDILSACTDIPIEYYAERWAQRFPNRTDTEHRDSISTSSPPKSPAPGERTRQHVKESQYKRSQTRAENRKERVKFLNTTLPDEDMRRHGGTMSLIEGLDDLKQRISK